MTDNITNENNYPDVISLENLKVFFPVRSGLMGKISGYVKAVNDITLNIRKGEVFALVGESGCGKSTTARAVLGLEEITGGNIKIAAGKWKNSPVSWDILTRGSKKELRRNIQIVFQDPFSSLDPRMNVRAIIEEPMRVHRIPDISGRLKELLNQTGLSESILNRYPHEFSGGQRQRIAVARALAIKPEVIVADEPVSALDVSIQAQIINLLQEMQRRYNLTMLFISHDLSVVRHIADIVAVMYKGRIMELGTNSQIFEQHAHPYTALLLESIPEPGKKRIQKKHVLESGPEKETDGRKCPFMDRCPERIDECLSFDSRLYELEEGHMCACVRKTNKQ